MKESANRFPGAMKTRAIGLLLILLLAAGFAMAGTDETANGTSMGDPLIGRIEISTVPFPAGLRLRSATYTPSGKVLVSYAKSDKEDRLHVNLAVMDDDGENMRPFFSQEIPLREKGHGVRYMVFPDNRRIFLGDFIIECTPDVDTCIHSTLFPVKYPREVAGGANVLHRWSEIIVAPDNRHIAWTTLLTNDSSAVLTGRLKKEKTMYKIIEPRIVSTVHGFKEDPEHPGAVIPNPVRGGEVKQFVEGGLAISLVGAKRRNTPDSVVLDLTTGDTEQITHNPGYDETTIFSPDEKLGMTMTTRFSKPTNMAILGLMPRPYPVSLNLGLGIYIYTYSVAGVRQSRSGNIGPALIDIEASRTRKGYRGVDLHTQAGWVYYSPMSWAPSGKKAMWIEGRRDSSRKRIRVVHLLDYKPGPAVAVKATPDAIPFAVTDLSVINDFVRQQGNIDVKVYGHYSGYIEYRRTIAKTRGTIEKTYVDFSDDGRRVYTGTERMQLNPRGYSTYTADVKLSGPKPGVMNLKITFGPLRSKLPARLVFTRDGSGTPLTHGFTEYDGQRLDIGSLVP